MPRLWLRAAWKRRNVSRYRTKRHFDSVTSTAIRYDHATVDAVIPADCLHAKDSILASATHRRQKHSAHLT